MADPMSASAQDITLQLRRGGQARTLSVPAGSTGQHMLRAISAEFGVPMRRLKVICQGHVLDALALPRHADRVLMVVGEADAAVTRCLRDRLGDWWLALLAWLQSLHGLRVHVGGFLRSLLPWSSASPK